MESTEDAVAQMPRYFVIGSCTGRFLLNFQQLLTKVSLTYWYICRYCKTIFAPALYLSSSQNFLVRD
jgi:hypothetical protein